MRKLFFLLLFLPIYLFSQISNDISTKIAVIDSVHPVYIALNFITYILFLASILIFIVNLFDFSKLNKVNLRMMDKISLANFEKSYRLKIRPLRIIFEILVGIGFLSFVVNIVILFLFSFKGKTPVFIVIYRNIGNLFDYIKLLSFAGIIIILFYLYLEASLERQSNKS